MKKLNKKQNITEKNHDNLMTTHMELQKLTQDFWGNFLSKQLTVSINLWKEHVHDLYMEDNKQTLQALETTMQKGNSTKAYTRSKIENKTQNSQTKTN